MHDCHCSSSVIDISPYLGSSGELVFILSVFITGILGSVTHCISMCGPIAMLQSSMRMMHISNDKMSQKERWKALLAMPYYLGKTFTYIIYYLLAEFLTSSFKETEFYSYFIGILMLISGFAFVSIALTKNIRFNNISTSSNNLNFLSKLISKLNLNPFGIKGFFMGIILGFIPCGFVYAVIIAITTMIEDLTIGIFTTLLFGLATMPGLVFISFCGNYLIEKHKSLFTIALRFTAMINAYLLFKAAYVVIIL